MATDLSNKMLERAERDNLPADHELRIAAHAFATACAGFYGDPQTCPIKTFMGTWARTRKLWCKYSCESLV